MTPPTRAENPPPTVSVVVTAHDAAGTIGDCLRSLAAQRGLPPGGVEILLIDDRSSDGTADAARAAGVPGLRIERIDAYDDRRLTARQVALDLGIAAARGACVSAPRGAPAGIAL